MRSIAEQLEEALGKADRIAALRELVINLNNSGFGKDEIYQQFLEFYRMLQTAGRDQDEADLGDVMDMMTGYYSGRNLNLK